MRVSSCIGPYPCAQTCGACGVMYQSLFISGSRPSDYLHLFRSDSLMASLHTIDPDGDVDLLLQQEETLQPDIRFNVPSPPASLNYKRPSTLVHKPFKEFLLIPGPESALVAKPTISDESAETAPDVAGDHVISKSNGTRVRIRVSSKHLVLASSYFKHNLGSGLAESCTLQSKGHVELPMDGQGLSETLIVMNIIHNRNRQVPPNVNLDTLTKIAVLVDYLECHEAIEPFSDMWIAQLEMFTGIPNDYSRALVQWLCISLVFDKPTIFNPTSFTVINHATGPIETLGLPIRVEGKKSDSPLGVNRR
jgi:hypothetical protein